MPWLTRYRGAARLVVPVTVVLLVGACTGGTPEATETSTPRVDVTPSAPPTPTEPSVVDVTVKPDRPAAMDQPPSIDGAVEVARYYLALYAYAYATGDLADWRAVSDESCVFCGSVMTNVEAMQSLGHKQLESGTEIHEARGTEVNPGTFYSVDVQATQGATTEVDADGAVVGTSASSEYALLFALDWNGGWTVREVDVTADER